MSPHKTEEVFSEDEKPHQIAIPSPGAPGVSYFTPVQNYPSGTAANPQPDGRPVPKIFTPLKIRGLTMQNRIMLSPLCQYSAENGHHTLWHFAHLGGIISRGPGMAMIESTAVLPEGRVTPQCSGIWLDSHIEPLKRITDFAHSQGQKMGIQLGHGGRKASTVAPWLSKGAIATEEVGGWPDKVKAPSAIPYAKGYPMPQAMTLEDIEDFKTAFAAGVRRALKAGFDVIEVHSAHGRLLHQFLSPASNVRTDRYGGSFENRVRLTLEVVELTRAIIPDTMPLFVRISATDWLENTDYDGPSWTVEDSVRLAPMLVDRGVDLIDVSSGGLHAAQKIEDIPSYQAPFARKIKKAVGERALVSTVGRIVTGKQANDLLEGAGGEEPLDVTAVGRMFQKEPGLVWRWAGELGVQIHVANQIRWGFSRDKTVAQK
ncbi:FMN-linked oxidoreductase [Hypoxylon cercidicola]|nr:FMN-linked oxidoreductase [Hypoxylon cercidicola]